MIGVSGQLHSLTMRGSRGIRSKTALSQNKLTLQLISQRFSSEWISNNSSPKYFSTSSSMRHSFSVGNAFNQHSINTLTTRTFSTVIPFKLADIGEGIAEVELMKWFVKEGDNVKSFDRICEVQSDKATVEITSRYDGKIAKVHYAEGAIVKVGATLIDIQAGDSTGPKLVNEDMPNKAAPIETKAADLDDANIFNIHDDQVLTTPAVRKLAKENNIRLDMVKGTGPKGRIIKEDILSHIYSGNSSSTVSKQSSSSISTQLNIPSTEKVALKSENVSVKEDVVKVQPIVRETFAEDKRVPIRGIQRLMVKSMNAANQVKHLTLGEEIVCDKLVSLRKLLKDVASKQGIKLSYMPIIIKATSLALLQYPMLNATVAEDASEMVYHANHNIGVAIDTSKGLIVPVIKQVQRKSILEITEELNALQVRFLFLFLFLSDAYEDTTELVSSVSIIPWYGCKFPL